MNSYLAYIEQSKRGRWLFTNPFTPEEHEPVFFNLQWLLVGKLAGFFHLSPDMTFHVWRTLGGIFLIVAFSRVLRHFTANRGLRWAALVAFSVGGGFGWLHPFLCKLPPDGEYLPIDLMGGLHAFVQVLSSPGMLFPHGAILLAISSALHRKRSSSLRWVWRSSAWLLVAGLARPFDMVVGQGCFLLFAVTSAHWWRKGQRKAFAINLVPVLCCLPLGVYYYCIFSLHPVFKWWTAQNVVVMPHVSELFLATGLAGVFTLLGIKHLSFSPNVKVETRMLACWLGTVVFLTLLYPFASFSLQAGSTAISALILASLPALERCFHWLRSRLSRRVTICFAVGTLALNTLFVPAAIALAIRQLVFYRTDLIEAIRWLDSVAEEGDVVLSSPMTGNIVPVYSKLSSFCGYVYSTVDYNKKCSLVYNFFASETDRRFRLSLFHQYGVRYLIIGPYEQNLGPWRPSDRDIAFHLVWEYPLSSLKVYEIKRFDGWSRMDSEG